MIEVRELSKHYGEVTAIDNVTFRAETGKIMGFLGPNGAGKTTTMRIVTCYLPPSSGTATVDGFDVTEESMEVRRRIGYLPELQPLYSDMTVEAYLGFVARIKGVPSAVMSSRIDETMEKTGVAHVRRSLIGHLSKGYRQRVGLAQALVHNPSVLILDEPTVGVDPKGTADFTEVNYRQATALVVGAEGKGLSRLVKERCDALARIPMRGRMASLNASVSAALVMYESMRQRRGVGAGGQNKPTGRS